MKHFDVVIIGAGAAGLMCAQTAGQRNRRVLVIDHANKVGKKILLSGGGRCNFTNRYASPQQYLSANPFFCISALKRYTQIDFENLVKKHGIPYHEKTLGQLFCNDSAKDILGLLLKECDLGQVEIALQTTVQEIQKKATHFRLKTSMGLIECEYLVIASGGLSFPTMGASPYGYKVAEQFGLNILPVRAGLVPLTLQPTDLEKFSPLAGVSLDVEVSCNNQTFKEALLFTHRGLSGPAILQISSYWQAGQALTLNLLPDLSILDYLHAKKTHSKATLKTILTECMPSRLAHLLTEHYLPNKALQQCSDKALLEIAHTLSAWSIKPNGTEGYRTAEVTLGGIDTDEISSKTFESKKVPDLYFIGEVLDVTGHLGGFNFQWAWSSGFCCGQFV